METTVVLIRLSLLFQTITAGITEPLRECLEEEISATNTD